MLLLLTANDIALNLCNVVAGLGIPRFQVRERAILKHRTVGALRLNSRLEKIRGVAKTYAHERHEFLHHGSEVKVGELDIPSLIEFGGKLARQMGEPSPSRLPPGVLDLAIAAGLVDLIRRLHDDREAIRKAIDQFFDALVPVYDLVTGMLRQETAPSAGHASRRR